MEITTCDLEDVKRLGEEYSGLTEGCLDLFRSVTPAIGDHCACEPGLLCVRVGYLDTYRAVTMVTAEAVLTANTSL